MKMFSNLKDSTKIVLIFVAAVLVLAGAGFYYYFSNGDDQPPQLTTGGELFKGSVDSSELYFEFKGNLNTYEFKALNYGAKPADLKNLKQGFNYVYSIKDLTIGDIISYIKPMNGNKILIIYYDPAARGWHVYPKGPYQDTTTITSTESSTYTIPAFHGFMILSRDNTTIYKDIIFAKEDLNAVVNSLPTDSEKEKANQGLNALESYVKSLNGWMLVPIGKNTNVSTSLNSIKNIVLSIAVLKGDESGFDAATKDVAGFGTPQKGMAWVKFGELNCDSDEYPEYGECKSCALKEDRSGCEEVDDGCKSSTDCPPDIWCSLDGECKLPERLQDDCAKLFGEGYALSNHGNNMCLNGLSQFIKECSSHSDCAAINDLYPGTLEYACTKKNQCMSLATYWKDEASCFDNFLEGLVPVADSSGQSWEGIVYRCEFEQADTAACGTANEHYFQPYVESLPAEDKTLCGAGSANPNSPVFYTQ
ncbi:MAG: hypothetical protein PHP74_04910, partial [Candidatus Gracilibacteria bacterium]|nr:hypothetical protein [Candidatus Gracilibacteria bacterium]